MEEIDFKELGPILEKLRLSPLSVRRSYCASVYWRDPRIPNNWPPFPNQLQARDHIASTGYQSRGNFSNSSVGRQFASANLAVRGCGSSSLSRGSSGRGSSSSSHFRTDDSRPGEQKRSQQSGRYFSTPCDDQDYYVRQPAISTHT